MTSRIRFSVLGPLRAWRGELEVELGSPQQQATLAALLLREERLTHGRELVTAIWGNDPPPAAPGTIRTYISRLRRVLEAADPESLLSIDSMGGGYALRLPAGALDLGLFRQHLARARTARRQADPATAATALRQAIGLWSGAPLAGLPGPYAETQRGTLEQALLTARTHRMAVELELGHHAETLTELYALSEENPLREQFQEFLMLALYRLGRSAEALAVYDEVRSRLADELGVDPGPRLQTVRQAILERDVKLLRPPPNDVRPRTKQVNPVRITMPTPHQLPADLPDFTGRETVLDEIINAVSRTDVVPIVAIGGMGGIGKTALAIRAAHRVSEQFSDGQVFVKLDALSDHPADPLTILAGLLRAFGVDEESLPPTIAERAAQWRTILAGRRVLIVLDDVGDQAQVRDLLPAAPGCAAILTGRQRILDLPGSHWSTLDVFDPTEALTLLSRIAGVDRVAAEPNAVRQLATACSHIPHALRIVGARLLDRPRWSVAELADRAAEELNHLSTGNPDSIVLPFARGYRHLDAQQARVFRLLAVPEGEDIDLVTAAVMLELPENLTESVLESLANVHLIEAGHRGRYRYHSLVRLFARRQAFAEDGPAACLTALARLSRCDEETARTLSLCGSLTGVIGSSPGALQIFPRFEASAPESIFDDDWVAARQCRNQAAAV